MTQEQSPEKQENVYLIDTESAAENARLIQQGRLLTKCMGGLLVELPDLTRFQRILDIACGSGEWALDLAFAHPEIEVVGMDISQRMTDAAFGQARIQGLENVQFLVMDATRPLDFPSDSFDLVNARTIAGMMPQATWPLFIKECARILRPGGIIRLTECDTWGITNSPAFEALNALAMLALKRAGAGFSPDGRTFTITPLLKRLLQNAGYTHIQEKSFFNNFSTNEISHQCTYRNYMAFYQLAQSALLKFKVASKEEIDELYKQMQLEMLNPDFGGIAFFLTVWGEPPQTT